MNSSGGYVLEVFLRSGHIDCSFVSREAAHYVVVFCWNHDRVVSFLLLIPMHFLCYTGNWLKYLIPTTRCLTLMLLSI